MIDPERERDVLLAFCHNGSLAFCFFDAVFSTVLEDMRRGREPGGRRRLVEWQGSPGPYIHENRSRAARYFLEETDYQWLWFCDNDMRFTADALYVMLRAAEKYECSILGAAYWNTFGPVTRALSWVQFTTQGLSVIADLPLDESGLPAERPIGVSAVGMGCTLIHRDVIEALHEHYGNDPWPTFAPDILVICNDGACLGGRTPAEVEEAGAEHLQSGVAYSSRVGEDVTFCLRAAKLGFRTYGLASVVASHFKPQWVAESGFIS